MMCVCVVVLFGLFLLVIEVHSVGFLMSGSCVFICSCAKGCEWSVQAQTSCLDNMPKKVLIMFTVCLILIHENKKGH